LSRVGNRSGNEKLWFSFLFSALAQTTTNRSLQNRGALRGKSFNEAAAGPQPQPHLKPLSTDESHQSRNGGGGSGSGRTSIQSCGKRLPGPMLIKLGCQSWRYIGTAEL